MLEKDSRYTSDGYSSNDIQLSQAISLKRIADALERLQVPAKQPVVMSAEEYARYEELKETRDKAAANLPLTLEEIEQIKDIKPYGFVVNKG